MEGLKGCNPVWMWPASLTATMWSASPRARQTREWSSIALPLRGGRSPTSWVHDNLAAWTKVEGNLIPAVWAGCIGDDIKNYV
jgi:hypothetical protein